MKCAQFSIRFFQKLLLLFFGFAPSILLAQDSADFALQYQALVDDPQKKKTILSDWDTVVQEKKLSEKAVDACYYYYARYLFQTRELERAKFLTQEAITFLGENSEKREKAKFYNILGSIYALSGDYKSAIEQYNFSIRILETHHDFLGSALIKNNVANIFFSLRDYESAYKYAESSYSYLKEVQDTVYLPSITGIAAISAIKMERNGQGEILTKECLELSERYNNPVGLIVGYHAGGELEQLNGNYLEAVTYFEKSLALSEQYYQPHYSLLNNITLLHAHLELKNYQRAIDYGQEAWEKTEGQKNDDIVYALNKNLGYAYAGLEQYEEAFFHLRMAHEKYMSISGTENRQIINDILIKYETEEKEKELAQQKLEIVESDNQIQKQNFWIILLAASFLVILLVYIFYRTSQKQKMERLKVSQEKRLLTYAIRAEEKERKRLSYEMHDGLASALTGIRLQLSHYQSKEGDEHPTLNEVNGQIEKLHEEVRRISHNLMPHNFENEKLVDVIKGYCKENSTSGLSIEVADNRTNKGLRLSPQASSVLYRIFQELINNTRKHANATYCFVQILNEEREIVISVEDNGLGFEPKKENFKQGLSSIEDRMNELGGTFELESSNGKGTLALIRMQMKQ